MPIFVDQASAPVAPHKFTVLANTGTTERTNAKALPNGKFATLKVGKTRIRVVWTRESGLSNIVGSTDFILEAGERFDWVVSEVTQYVYIEAEDGSTAYQAWLWTSSP
jgi:hypothetical protein